MERDENWRIQEFSTGMGEAMRHDYDLASNFDQEDFSLYRVNVICYLKRSHINRFEEA